MNERMKDLVGQAKFMAEESINKKISANDELYAFSEKFAELIVGECAGVELYWLSEHDRIAVAEKIKQHFGVGMTTEDKKTLIKELLGVKNEIN